MISSEILNDENYTFKIDIWNLGIIIYFMLNKENLLMVKLNYYMIILYLIKYLN